MTETYTLPTTMADLLAVIATVPIDKATRGQGWSTEFDVTDDGQGGYDESTVLELRVDIDEALYERYDWTEVRDLTSGTAWEYDTYEQNQGRWQFVFTRDTAARPGMFEEAGE